MISEYSGYVLWRPQPGQLLEVAHSGRMLSLPDIPIPLEKAGYCGGVPDSDLLGRSVSAYLRQFPDAPGAEALAQLLREGFSHFLSDMASQIVMISGKDVDPPYLKRKINYLRIFALLEPQNASLRCQIGLGYFELGSSFTEFADSRRHFQSALGYLASSCELNEASTEPLPYMALIHSYLGDFPSAVRCYRKLHALVQHPATGQSILEKIAELESVVSPDGAMILEMEEVGEAMSCYSCSHYQEGLSIMERLEEQGTIFHSLPSPDLHVMLGLLREKTHDLSGAMKSYLEALELDKDSEVAAEGIERIRNEVC